VQKNVALSDGVNGRAADQINMASLHNLGNLRACSKARLRPETWVGDGMKDRCPTRSQSTQRDAILTDSLTPLFEPKPKHSAISDAILGTC